MRKAFILLFLIYSSVYSNRLYSQSWQWAAGCTGGSEGVGFASDIWGNVYTSGFSNPAYGWLTFGNITLENLGSSAAVAVKYNAAGNLVWANSTHNGFARPVGIAADESGHLYMLAYYLSNKIEIGAFTLIKPSSDTELFLAKFDPAGGVIWAKNLCPGNFSGAIAISGSGIFVTSSYNAPAIGIGAYTLHNIDPSGATFDFFTAKLDTSGGVTWARTFGGNNDDLSTGIAVSASGNFYVCGNFSSSLLALGSDNLVNSATSLFLAKYDASGGVLWGKITGGNSPFPVGVATDAYENAFITGTFYKTTLTFDSYVFTTDSPSTAFVAMYSGAGDVGWAKEIRGNANIFGHSAVTDICGNLWICGNIPKGDTSYVIVDGNILRAPADERDPLFMAHWTSSGVFLGATALPTAGDDIATIGTDGVGNIYIGGDYWGGPYTIGGTLLNDPKHDYEDIMLAKFVPYHTPDTSRTYKLVCMTDSAVLDAPPGYLAYKWEDGSTATLRTVHSPGTYSLYCIGQCGKGVLKSTFRVDYGHLDTAYTHTDTSICLFAQMAITAPSGYSSYYWYDGDTAQSDTISAIGNYWVICSGTCTVPTLFDMFNVSYNDIDLSFSLGNDTDVCAPYLLKVPLSGVSCVWQDNSGGNTYEVTAQGTYFVFVNRQGCFNSDTVSVNFPNLAQNLRDTVVCRDKPVQITLKANAPHGSSVLWSTGSTEHEITINTPAQYWVNVTKAACSGSDSMTLADKFCYCTALLPDAFTPNNDGLNDYFSPIIDKACGVYDYSFCIYNRWGQLIFTTHDPERKWDGRFIVTPQDLGVYMYYLEYRAVNSYYKHFYKGDVTLIR